MTASVLTGLDWVMIIALIGFSLTVGILVKDQAATGGMEGFFVAGRNMRWWFLGTSIVATTFASDTPLVITGWIAQYGIAGNWFWWSQVIATVAMTVFFARKWRNSGVVTDVEIAELRYGGRQATLLKNGEGRYQCYLRQLYCAGGGFLPAWQRSPSPLWIGSL